MNGFAWSPSSGHFFLPSAEAPLFELKSCLQAKETRTASFQTKRGLFPSMIRDAMVFLFPQHIDIETCYGNKIRVILITVLRGSLLRPLYTFGDTETASLSCQQSRHPNPVCPSLSATVTLQKHAQFICLLRKFWRLSPTCPAMPRITPQFEDDEENI